MYLLDSSAWLAHLFGEPGMAEVSTLLTEEANRVHISVLSLPEVYTRLKALGEETKWPLTWSTYQPLFAQVLTADERIAHQAIILRAITPQRLPTIDALIAATAVVYGFTLVHRDPHLAAIPVAQLPQIQLPER